jgi:chromosome partitioning protein
MKTIAVINYKGGVGKTTVTANLAAYAARQGKRVLMVDLDPQASLTFSFMSVDDWKNIRQTKTLYQFFKPYAEGKAAAPALDDLVVSLSPLGVKMDLLSSHLTMIDTEAGLSSLLAGGAIILFQKNFVSTYTLLRNGLHNMKNPYDLVFIDCPPSFHAIVKNAIIASDMYIIPAKMDFLSTIGISQLEANMKSYIEEYNTNAHAAGLVQLRKTPPKLLGIVPTMLTLYRGDPISDARPYLDSLRNDYKYHLFPWLQEKASFYAPAPQIRVPAVLNTYYRPGFVLAKRELESLGKEVLSAAEV